MYISGFSRLPCTLSTLVCSLGESLAVRAHLSLPRATDEGPNSDDGGRLAGQL